MLIAAARFEQRCARAVERLQPLACFAGQVGIVLPAGCVEDRCEASVRAADLRAARLPCNTEEFVGIGRDHVATAISRLEAVTGSFVPTGEEFSIRFRPFVRCCRASDLLACSSVARVVETSWLGSYSATGPWTLSSAAVARCLRMESGDPLEIAQTERLDHVGLHRGDVFVDLVGAK
jgi:hypothetical protein